MAHKMEVQTSGKSMSAQLFADAYHSAQPTVVLRDVNTPNTKWLLDNLPEDWLLKHSKIANYEARQAAQAWDTLRLWMAVCWEYALTLMRAQHVLRDIYGLPPPWKFTHKKEEEQGYGVEEKPAEEQPPEDPFPPPPPEEEVPVDDAEDKAEEQAAAAAAHDKHKPQKAERAVKEAAPAAAPAEDDGAAQKAAEEEAAAAAQKAAEEEAARLLAEEEAARLAAEEEARKLEEEERLKKEAEDAAAAEAARLADEEEAARKAAEEEAARKAAEEEEAARLAAEAAALAAAAAAAKKAEEEEAARCAAEEAAKKAAEDEAARLAAEAAAKKAAEEEAARKAAEAEAARCAAEAAAKKKAEAEAAAKKAAEEAAAKKAAEEAAKKAAAEEAARCAAEAAAKKKAEDAAKKAAEEEAKKKEAEELAAKRAAELAAKKAAEEEAARLAAEKKAAAEAERKKAAEEAAAKKAAEEAAKKAALEEAARKAAEEAAARKAAEEAAKKAAAEAAKKAAEEAAAKRAAEKAAKEAAKQAEAEAAAKRMADAAARKAAAEEAAKKAAEEEAARKLAEKEARRVAAEEAAKKAAEEAAAMRAAAVAEKEARRLAAEEAARKGAEERAAKRAAEKEARRLAAEEVARRAAEEAANKRAMEQPEYAPAPQDGTSSLQRLRAKFGDAFHAIKTQADGAPPAPEGAACQMHWTAFRDMMEGMAVPALTGTDWTDLKPFLVLVKRNAHITWEPLAAAMAPEGPEIGVMLRDAKTPEQRIRLRMSAPVHGVLGGVAVEGQPQYLQWSAVRDQLAGQGFKFTPQDWADLQALGLLSVTANSNTDEGRPLQMTTWVDWQGLLKIIGPDGPLLEAIPKPPTGIDGAQTGRLRTKLADALYLTTKAGALPKGDAAQAMSWRDFMALVNKSGAKLGEADPVWWDLQQYMRPQGSVMVVDAAAVAELLKPDAPEMAQPPADLSGAAERLRARYSEPARAMYNAAKQPPAPARFVLWSEFQEGVVASGLEGGAVTAQDWADMQALGLLPIPTRAGLNGALFPSPLRAYVDFTGLLKLVGPDGPEYAQEASGAAGAAGGEAAAAEAEPAAPQEPEAGAAAPSGQEGVDAAAAAAAAAGGRTASPGARQGSPGRSQLSSMQQQHRRAALGSPGAGGHRPHPSKSDLALARLRAKLLDSLLALGPKATNQKDGLASGVPPSGLLPWRNFQSVLEQGGVPLPAPMGPQDWSDMRTLGLLNITLASTHVNWARLKNVVKPDGPEAVPPIKDGRSPEQRLRSRLGPALKAVAAGSPADLEYMHWRGFEDALAQCGVRLRAADWGDLVGRYTCVTTSATDAQCPAPHAVYVHYWGLLKALFPSLAAAKRPGSRAAEGQGQGGQQGTADGQQQQGAQGQRGQEEEGDGQQGDGSDPFLVSRQPFSSRRGPRGLRTSDPAGMYTQPHRSPSPGRRSPGLLPTRFPKAGQMPQLAGLDRTLYDELLRLLTEMQGRGLVKPDAQSWDIALAKLRRQVDQDYAEHRRVMADAPTPAQQQLASGGTPGSLGGSGPGSTADGSTMPPLQQPRSGSAGAAGGGSGGASSREGSQARGGSDTRLPDIKSGAAGQRASATAPAQGAAQGIASLRPRGTGGAGPRPVPTTRIDPYGRTDWDARDPRLYTHTLMGLPRALSPQTGQGRGGSANGGGAANGYQQSYPQNGTAEGLHHHDEEEEEEDRESVDTDTLIGNPRVLDHDMAIKQAKVAQIRAGRERAATAAMQHRASVGSSPRGGPQGRVSKGQPLHPTSLGYQRGGGGGMRSSAPAGGAQGQGGGNSKVVYRRFHETRAEGQDVLSVMEREFKATGGPVVYADGHTATGGAPYPGAGANRQNHHHGPSSTGAAPPQPEQAQQQQQAEGSVLQVPSGEVMSAAFASNQGGGVKPVVVPLSLAMKEAPGLTGHERSSVDLAGGSPKDAPWRPSGMHLQPQM